MKFPVDFLAHVSQEELERSAQNYMNTLLYSNPDCPESITLSDSTEVVVNISTVGFVPLYGSSDRQKILALFTPSDPFTAVALYLLNRWWTISDVLKTEDGDRDGVVEVQTVGERIVLYSLNRVIYRAKEMSSEELPFLCHGETDYAKILWHSGEAVGFYSVKPTGSLCSSFSTRSYELPVMDSIFVRKSHRGNGYGLQMLKDYVLSFNDSCLGLRYPLATAMYKVCQKYLSQYPGDTDVLWEVQSIGGPNQRTNIANKIQVMDLSAVSKRLMYTEEPVVIMEERQTSTVTTMLKNADSVKCTVEILEEVTIVRGAKDADEVHVATWDKSNGSKLWKIGENITEDKTEKVIRIEDIEAESPGEDQVSEQQITDDHHMSEQADNEDMLSVATEGKTEVEAGEDSVSVLDKTTTVQVSDDLESESPVAPAAEERQVEDTDLCGLNTLCDPQIAIENVVSEIEEAQKKDSTVVSGEVVGMCKEAEMVEMEWGAKNEACEEELAEIVIQQVKSQSTHATSAKEKAEKRGQAVHNEPPQLRSHRKAEGRVLRGRTVVGSLAPKRKSTQQSQKVGKKLETESSSAEEIDEQTGTEGEYGGDLTAAPEEDEIGTEISKTDQEQKNEEVEGSLIQDEAEESDKEKEPPVVQRRALRAASKATPPRKSTRHSKRHQKQQDEQTEDLESQECVREEKIEQQVQEDQMEKDDGNKSHKDIPDIEINEVENKVEVTLSTEENMEECKEIPEEGKTQELVDTEAVVEEGKEEEEAGTVTADVTETGDSVAGALIPDEAGEQNVPSVVSADRTEEPSKNNAGNSDIPKLHKAAVMLVDIKTASHVLQANNTEEIQATTVSTAAENEEIILTTAGASEKEDPTSVAEQKESEPQQVEKVVEEGPTEGNSGKDMESDKEFEDKQFPLSETSADKEEDCTIQNFQENAPLAGENEGMSLDKEEVSLVQTRALRSGTITIIDTPGHHRIRRTEDQHDEAEKTDGKADEETFEGGEVCLEPDVELQQEKEVAGEANLEQNVGKQQSEVITEKERDVVVDVSREVRQDGEDAGEKTMTASEKEENAADLTTVTDDSKGAAPENQNETAADSTLIKTNEDEKILRVEEQQSERVALQLTDLPRLSVVLVDLKKSQHGVQTETDAELPQDETTVEEKTTEEIEPAKETRLLRGGMKSISATPRRKSKTVSTQPQIEAEPSENMQIEETIAEVTQENQEEEMEEKKEIESTTQKEDNKDSEADVETVEESVPEQGPVEETPATQSVEDLPTTEEAKASDDDIPVLVTRVLRSGQKTVKATQDDQATEEDKSSEEDEPAKETRVLRRGRKSASATPRRKSKRTRTQPQKKEKEVREDTASAEAMQVEEITDEETQDNQEEKMEEKEEIKSTIQKEDNKDSDADENLDNIQTADSVQATDEEEAPAAQTTVLESDQKTMKATQDEEEQEEKDTEDGKPVIETRVLRSGKKCATKISKRPYKRTCTQTQTEEDDVEEETDPIKKIQLEEAISKETQDNNEEMTEDREKVDATTQREDNDESETEVEKEAVAEESVPEQGTVEETSATQSVEDLPTTEEAKTMDKEDIPDTEEDKSAEEDEPAKETRVLRGGRKSASATSRRKSKRDGKQPQTEEKEERGPTVVETQVEETNAEEKQDREEGMEEKEDCGTTIQKEDNKESQSDVEKAETVLEESLSEQGTAEDTPAPVSVEDLPTTEEAKTTDKEDIPDTEEDKSTEEDEPAIETRVLRGGRKSASATPKRKSKRARKQPQTDEKEETEEAEPSEYIQIEETAEETQDNQEEKTKDRLEDESTTQKEDDRESEPEEAVAQSISKQDQIEEQEDESNKEEKILIKMTDIETSSEKGDDLTLELDPDEEVETASLNQEEEDEQSLSEEDEQILIRGKVLRGRAVPSIIITPKSRRHSAKVQKAKESSSDEDLEHNPKRRRSAQRSSKKRRSSEITPSRRSKRHRI